SPELRQQLDEEEKSFGFPVDEDSWIIWSDDGYGDPEGLRLPALPVSRIPDGQGGDLVLSALSCQLRQRPFQTRWGIANRSRPYAGKIFAQLPGEQALRWSAPSRTKDLESGSPHQD